MIMNRDGACERLWQYTISTDVIEEAVYDALIAGADCNRAGR